MIRRWRTPLLLVALATAVRVAWALAVPTIPVGDFATYRESAMYLAEHGQLDGGFVYMPGLVVLLAGIYRLGGEVLADKLLGAVIGGAATGAIYVIAARLGGARAGGVPDAEGDRPAGPGGGGGGAVAVVAAVAYAVWPAGVAMASVVGTDVPAAAAIVAALALLAALGPSRPRAAAVAYGAAMGVAAYFRAVALPLSVLGAAYWVATRAGLRATVARTALAVAATVLVLLPWGLRNWRGSGELYLTDSHGGVTALMGNDPNTEGTYSRSLGLMFHDLTGRTFLSPPHRQTDRAAYALVRRWIAFEPAFAAGMVAMRLERLFAAERGLLYWPVYRRGVLPAERVRWFDAHWWGLTSLADLFYVLLIVGTAGGLGFAVVERRWAVLAPLPAAAALAAIYALFVAEPRYRLTTEVLLFPQAAFGWVRMAAAARAAVARARGTPVPAAVKRGLVATAAVLAVGVVGALVVVRGGAALRARHRWAATVAEVAGRATPALWRRAGAGPGPSPVRGAPSGAALTLPAAVAGPAALTVTAEILIADDTLAPGRYRLRASLAWTESPPADAPARLTIAADGSAGAMAAPAGAAAIAGDVSHAGGPLWLRARLERTPGGSPSSISVWVSDLTVAPVASR